jgi:hypothetical protein
MRILVCGGRDYARRDEVFRVLDDVQAQSPGHLEIIHGAARGADSLAGAWAMARGAAVRIFRPEREMRGGLMLEDGSPHLVVAFPGGKGTADMVRQAKAAGVKVIEIPDMSEFW